MHITRPSKPSPNLSKVSLLFTNFCLSVLTFTFPPCSVEADLLICTAAILMLFQHEQNVNTQNLFTERLLADPNAVFQFDD